MLPTVRRDYHIASYLYFAMMAVNLAVNFYSIFKYVGPLLMSSDDPILGGVIFLGCALLVVLFIRVGFGIRAGKMWAKVLFVMYAAWNIFPFLRQAPTLAPGNIDYWVMLRNLFSTGLFLSISFFLFRSRFTRCPAEPVAEGLAE